MSPALRNMLLSQYSNCPDPFLAEMAGWLVVPAGAIIPPEFQPSFTSLDDTLWTMLIQKR